MSAAPVESTPSSRADIQGIMKEKLHDVVESDVSNRVDTLHAILPRNFLHCLGQGRKWKNRHTIRKVDCAPAPVRWYERLSLDAAHGVREGKFGPQRPQCNDSDGP